MEIEKLIKISDKWKNVVDECRKNIKMSEKQYHKLLNIIHTQAETIKNLTKEGE